MKRRRYRRRSDNVDMFANYEKLIATQDARISRLEATLQQAKDEREAARNLLARMRAEAPGATPPSGKR